WPMVTPFISQLALSFGCDDVEGTVVYERIYHEAGAETPMGMTYESLVRMIEGAGKTAVERDSLYQPVRGPGSGGGGLDVSHAVLGPGPRSPDPVSMAE